MENNEVVSDPHSELAVNNGKYVKNCVELHMARRGITRLRNFEPFTNLEVLWLNDNRIRKLSGLDSNIRIKRLYLHNNCITSLRGSLKCFTFLNVLTLQNNNLKNLKLCLEYLVKCRYLKQLDMQENPVAAENNYRLIVIGAMPWLEVFDSTVITDFERQEAKRLARSSGEFDKSAQKSPKRESINWKENVSALTRMTDQKVRRVEARERKREAEERKNQLSGASFYSTSTKQSKKCPLYVVCYFFFATKFHTKQPKQS
eukprot:GSMAST32.ASY1.ANO1.2245.1 assembled CDS